MKKKSSIFNPECRNCGDRIAFNKVWKLCPFCRRAWARGAFWSGLAVGAVVAAVQHFETIAGFFKR